MRSDGRCDSESPDKNVKFIDRDALVASGDRIPESAFIKTAKAELAWKIITWVIHTDFHPPFALLW